MPWKRRRNESYASPWVRGRPVRPVSRLGLVCVDEGARRLVQARGGSTLQCTRYGAASSSSRRGGLRARFGHTVGHERAAVRGGKLERLRLPDRARPSAALPSVQIVDLKRIGAGPTGEPPSEPTAAPRPEHVLAERQQAILFSIAAASRRAWYAKVAASSCRDPDCSVALTLHRRGRTADLPLLRPQPRHAHELSQVRRPLLLARGHGHRARRDASCRGIPGSAHRPARTATSLAVFAATRARAHATGENRYPGRHADGHQAMTSHV